MDYGNILGEYRCTAMENSVDYCRSLNINSFLVKLLPAAPMPYMTLSHDDDTFEYTFHGMMKVGPFHFDDIYKFKTDGSKFNLRITPKLFGMAEARWRDTALIFDVHSIPDGSAATIPANHRIEIKYYKLDPNTLIAEHVLMDEVSGSQISWQKITWSRLSSIS